MTINWRWLAIRTAALPFVFFAVSFTSYFVLYGPFQRDLALIIGGQGASQEQLDQIREAIGLDKPWYRGYVDWLLNAVQGDLGNQWIDPDRGVSAEIGKRLPETIELLIIATLTAGALGVVFAVYANKGGILGHIGVLGSSFSAAFPLFVTLILVIYYPAKWWSYGPPVGEASILDDPVRNLRLFGPPGLLMGVSVASLAGRSLGRERFTQSPIHWWPAAARAFAECLPWLAGATVVAETFFSVEGLGLLFRQSAFSMDLAYVHVVLTAATFLGVALWLFRPTPAPAAAKLRFDAPAVWRHPLMVVGAAIVVFYVLVAVVGPLVAQGDPRSLSIDDRFTGPSWDHWLGTNQLGQDMLARVLHGARDSLTVGIRVILAGFVTGGVVGVLGSRFASMHRSALRFAVSPLLGVPALLWLFAALGIVDHVLLFSLLAFPLGLWAGLDVGDLLSEHRTIFSRGAAALAGPVIVASLAEALMLVILLRATTQALGFVRLDEHPTTWGFDVSRGSRSLPEYPHVFWAPAAALTLTLLGFHLLAESLRSAIRDQSNATAGVPSEAASSGG